ncbi:MAG: hypothetical protein GF341_01185 [candidate division Zixibacteria bacterium]|nr:hypothetical protein [candidate division Zixibacteria bacterium]
MAFMFEKLEVYQRALELADQIIALGSKFPREFRFPADQLSRASVSIKEIDGTSLSSRAVLLKSVSRCSKSREKGLSSITNNSNCSNRNWKP